MTKHRILYCAYGHAACLILNILIKNLNTNPDDVICFTYKHIENKPLIKELEKFKVRYKTDNLNQEKSKFEINNFGPDVIISIYYRHLIPLEVLKMSHLGGFNLHPSLLPKYRGCFSAPWAIINGERCLHLNRIKLFLRNINT